MAVPSRALPRLALFVSASLLVAPLPVAAASGPQSVAHPVAATSDIIALPLNPTLPAGQRLCTDKTDAGLGYMMLRPATGAKPVESDYVLVNYIGYLAATGAVFDQGTRAAFPVNGVIPGFSKGLQMLAKGSIARFCIPAAMGYGAEASGPIPANADLVFQVELIDYKTAAEIEAIRKAEGADAASPPAAASPSPQ